MKIISHQEPAVNCELAFRHTPAASRGRYAESRRLRLEQLLREAELAVLALGQHIHQNLLFDDGAAAFKHLGQTISVATQDFPGEFPTFETKEDEA